MKEYIIQANAPETIACFDAHNAPEIIRCKDCKHGIDSSEHGVFCSKATYFDKYKDASWFCADGERKEGR